MRDQATDCSSLQSDDAAASMQADMQIPAQPRCFLSILHVVSRTQTAMLPLMRPATFYDVVMQVAVVRPSQSRATWSMPLCAGVQGTICLSPLPG